jgi:hypothetical protein
MLRRSLLNLSKERQGKHLHVAPHWRLFSYTEALLSVFVVYRIVVPEDGYLAKVHQLCKKHNVLLICDEIQTVSGADAFLDFRRRE